jgi:fibroblast growth factor receptor substrate 2
LRLAEPARLSRNVIPYSGFSGTLKVTENEIMFFRSGEETLVWPLHFLRRYGFTSSGVFSFESGRRCSTGEGLYSFTTQHAERIFQVFFGEI